MTSDIPSIVTLALDPIAGAVIVYVLLCHQGVLRMPKYHQLGLSLSAAGLFAQAFRSYTTVFVHVSPKDTEMVFWFLKDLGLVFLAFATLWTIIKRSREENRTNRQ